MDLKNEKNEKIGILLLPSCPWDANMHECANTTKLCDAINI